MKYNVVKITLSKDKSASEDNGELMSIAREIATAIAGEAGCESFEEDDTLVSGYVQEGLLDEECLKEGLSDFPIEGITADYKIEAVEDKNWNEQWEKQGFEPIVVDDRLIIHDTLHPVDCADKEEITIDAVQAFGTGTHDTTHMIVSHIINGAAKDKKVLDCGCGSGILSIASMRYGAHSVFAYDIDSWSADNTLHNAEINDVSGIDVHLGDAHVLDDITERFDLVLANINRNILLNDMPSFVRVMTNKASLVLSGFYTEDAPLLTDRATQLGLKPITQYSSNNWCCLVFERV